MADEQYYLWVEDKQEGPYSFEVVKGLLKSESLSKSDYIWKDGLADWTTIESLEEFSELASADAGTLSEYAGTEGGDSPKKKRSWKIPVITVIVLLLIGGASFAAYYFYPQIKSLFVKKVQSEYVNYYPANTCLYLSINNLDKVNIKNSNFYKKIQSLKDTFSKLKKNNTAEESLDIFKYLTGKNISAGVYIDKTKFNFLICCKVDNSDGMKKIKDEIKKNKLSSRKIGGEDVNVVKDFPVIDLKTFFPKNLMVYQNRGKVMSDIAAINSALASYYIDNKRYPKQEEGLNILVNKYLAVMPFDPWGGDYVYKLRNGNEYRISAIKKDGQEYGYYDSSEKMVKILEPLPVINKPAGEKGEILIYAGDEDLIITNDSKRLESILSNAQTASLKAVIDKYSGKIKAGDIFGYFDMDSIGKVFDKNIPDNLRPMMQTNIDLYKSFDYVIISEDLNLESRFESYTEFTKDIPDYLRNLYKKGSSSDYELTKYLSGKSIFSSVSNSFDYNALKEYVIKLISANPMQKAMIDKSLKSVNNDDINLDKVLSDISGEQAGFMLSGIKQAGMFPVPEMILVSKPANIKKAEMSLKRMLLNIGKTMKIQELEEEDYNSIKIYSLRTPMGNSLMPTYSINDGVLIFGVSKDAVKACIDNAKSGSDLTDDSIVKKNGSLKGSNVLMVFNMENLVKDLLNMAKNYQSFYDRQNKGVYKNQIQPVLDLLSVVQGMSSVSYYQDNGVKQKGIVILGDI